jgi:hypothetical protein
MICIPASGTVMARCYIHHHPFTEQSTTVASDVFSDHVLQWSEPSNTVKEVTKDTQNSGIKFPPPPLDSGAETMYLSIRGASPERHQANGEAHKAYPAR